MIRRIYRSLRTRIQRGITPILVRATDFLLHSRLFREAVYENLRKQRAAGRKTFLESMSGRGEWNEQLWRNFMATKSLAELSELQKQLVDGLDDLSRQVVTRFLATYLLFQMEDVCSFAPSGYQDGIIRFLPADGVERERLNRMIEEYRCPYEMPPGIGFPLPHMANHYGLTCLPPETRQRIHGKDVIDGGGYCGDSALVFSEYEPSRIHVFEPNPFMHEKMGTVFDLNQAALGMRRQMMHRVPLALAAEKGTLQLNMANDRDSAASVFSSYRVKQFVEVPTISIDEYVEEHRLNVGLVKLDIEGGESDAIRGAIRTITSRRPLLIVSIYHTPRDFFEIKPLIESWNLGYRLMIRHLEPSLSIGEYCLLAY